MDTNTATAIQTLLLVLTVLISLTALFLTVREMRRATHATAYKTVYDILQADNIRDARGFVMAVLSSKPFEAWTEQERKTAEKVCSSFDSVAIMVTHHYLPANLIIDNWGPTLWQTWPILEALVRYRRKRENAEELWDDYQRLAEQALKRKAK